MSKRSNEQLKSLVSPYFFERYLKDNGYVANVIGYMQEVADDNGETLSIEGVAIDFRKIQSNYTEGSESNEYGLSYHTSSGLTTDIYLLVNGKWVNTSLVKRHHGIALSEKHGLSDPKSLNEYLMLCGGAEQFRFCPIETWNYSEAAKAAANDEDNGFWFIGEDIIAVSTGMGMPVIYDNSLEVRRAWGNENIEVFKPIKAHALTSLTRALMAKSLPKNATLSQICKAEEKADVQAVAKSLGIEIPAISLNNAESIGLPVDVTGNEVYKKLSKLDVASLVDLADEFGVSILEAIETL